MKSSQTDPKISKYFQELAKKRTDNKRGFNDKTTVQKALETRKKNREAKRIQEETEKSSKES